MGERRRGGLELAAAAGRVLKIWGEIGSEIFRLWSGLYRVRPGGQRKFKFWAAWTLSGRANQI
jgi:hypothetical protein